MPVPVLEQVQRDLLALPGVGMSVMEISHRSADLRRHYRRRPRPTSARWPDIPANYKLLFLQGGATLQFSMVPLNLLGAGATADYIDDRHVGGQGRERSEDGSARSTIAGLDQGRQLQPHPDRGRVALTPGAAYVHITSNNTIEGTEWHALPASGDVPLVSDASSDIFSRPIDVTKYGLIYAGAQKNLGPSGVTLVIVRDDLLARSSNSLHTMLNYAVHAENGSLYNTPPAFGSTCSAW